jgi:hypothetical protein
MIGDVNIKVLVRVSWCDSIMNEICSKMWVVMNKVDIEK